MLNPIWLKTFQTLVETRHFTLTAQKLFMTQPGVTQHIQKLEQACGHSLLTRYNKRFELTERGKVVYQYALDAQQQFETLSELLNNDNPLAGTCTIACSGSMALYLYPQLLALQNIHRNLVIHLEVAPKNKILQAIEQGNVDIGIIAGECDQQLFKTQSFMHDELCLVLPATSKHEEITGEHLQQLGLIEHPDAHSYCRRYFTQCGTASLASILPHDLPSSGYINQLVQIIEPVALGLGFTVLPKNAVNAFAAHEKLFIYTPPKQVVDQLFCVTHRYRECPKRINFVLEQLLEQAVPKLTD